MTLDYRFITRYLFNGSNSESDITLVTIDQHSLNQLGDWPWPRQYQAQVIKNLTTAGAKVVGVDVIFNNGDPGEKLGDRKLVEATRQAMNVVYPVVLDLEITRSWLGDQKEQIEIKRKQLPFPELSQEAASLGYINLLVDRDGLVRRLPYIKDKEEINFPFSYQVAQQFSNGNSDQELDVNDSGLINYIGPPKSFPMISYYRVLNDEFSEKSVKDKIVLVGATAPGLGDRYMTPYSMFGAMDGVEVHANIIQTLLNDNDIDKLNFKLMSLIILIIGLINSYLFIWAKPKAGTLLLITEIIVLLLTSLFLFISYNLWLSLVPVLSNILLIYLVTLGYYYLWANQKQLQLKENFAHYLPAELVAEILRNPEQIKLGGKRQEVTVLFADIRGFTSYTEEHRAEEVVKKVNRYLTLMTESVLDSDGMLDKYMGDGIMAVFGAPVPDEKHLLKAIQAALQIQNTVNKHLDQDLGVGVGISRGEVITGNVGSKQRMDYTVIGDTVNLAARLEELAKPGQILLTARDYEIIKSRVEAEELKEVQIKGKQGEFKIYNLKRIIVRA